QWWILLLVAILAVQTYWLISNLRRSGKTTYPPAGPATAPLPVSVNPGQPPGDPRGSLLVISRLRSEEFVAALMALEKKNMKLSPEQKTQAWQLLRYQVDS